MNVLIKDMEMPKNCGACPLKASCVHRIYLERRPDYCPLVPVPDHGRCVDADEVKRIVQEHDYLLRDPILNSTDRGMWTIGVFQAIDEAQTVIPAKPPKEEA